MDDYENPRVRKLRGKTMAQQDAPQTLECCTMCGSSNLDEFEGDAVGGHYPIKWCEDCGSLHKRSPGEIRWETWGSEWFAKRHDDGCTCASIMKDKTRHFRGCPKRAGHPPHPAEIVSARVYDANEMEKRTFQALENMGIDTSCGVCMTIAFTGSSHSNNHTCRRREVPKLAPVLEERVKGKQELLREMARMFLGMSIADPKTFPWSLQGFGMFRLYISKRVRLHVWDPRFAAPNVTTIHSHPWHFTSTVVSGKMTDRLYEVLERNGSPLPTHHLQQIVCGPGGGAVGTPDSVRLKRLQEVTIEAGASYSLTAEAFHESVPEPGTITIIEREFLEDTEHAYVCVPYGQEWVSAEPRPALPDEVKEMAKFALAKMEEQ